MTYVNRIIYTKPYRKDNIDTGNDVNGDFPEVEESNDVNKCEHNDEDDHDADLNVAEK